jgi:Glucodextranase, domain B
VRSNSLRVALLAGALSLLALAGGQIASASAEVVSSRIISPASPAYAFYDETLPLPQEAFTVSGSVTGSGNVTLRCYYGPKAEEYSPVVSEVTPSEGSFSAKVEAKSLRDGPCVLRAVPVGNKEAHPPGAAAEESTDPFQGPRVGGSQLELFTENNISTNYDLTSNTLSGNFSYESAGLCGLYSRLYAPTSLASSEGPFECAAALYEADPATETRSELQIDGLDAYSPAGAYNLERKLKVKATLAGAPQLAVTETVESGIATIHEVDPFVECSPKPAVFPPTAESCTEFISTGVQLERTWQASNANHVAWLTDNWRSTDGRSHTMSALYDQGLVDASKEGGAYRFPGSSTFSATTPKQAVALPMGAGEIYYKEDVATPAGGDGVYPQGAIVYDRSPSEPLAVYRGSGESGYNEFEMPYQGTIPAVGTYTLRMAFIQAYSLSEVEMLANEAFASYHPTLTINSPVSGTTVSTPSMTVSGTASDTEGTPTLTVDGHAVNVGAGGTWSTSVTLSSGANTITAVATNQLGLSTEKLVSVTYTPPTPPVAHASQVGNVSGAKGQVTFTIACTGAAGTSCEVESALSTVEKTRNGRPVAVSARRHHPSRTRSSRVAVGSSKLTIPSGQQVTIAIQLNAAGKSLLARFGRLPVHLSVVLGSAGHRSTIIAQNLTVKPTPHKRRHKRHHHRR